MTRHAGREIYIVHLTDGSPYDLRDAQAAKCATRQEYAAARRAEFVQACKLLPVPEAYCLQLPFVDQELWRNLPDLVNQLDRLIRVLKPGVVLTPVYEGGHPDHDAAAFAVSLASRGGDNFEVREFPLYHAGPEGEMVVASFVNATACDVISFTAEERNLKRKMVESFPTQAGFLKNFPLQSETFRTMPVHDFTLAPHPGPLLYERWGWEVTGESWRQMARMAMLALT